MILSNLENVKFLHPVGASTFKYGVTIPVEAQTERMLVIEKGGKVSVTILFGNNEPIVAEIRRLNNKPGHLQFRYEKKAQERLRQYLQAVFGSQFGGNLLEVEEVTPFTFIFNPILKDASPCLHISDMLLHKLDKEDAKQFSEIEQIGEMLAAVRYDAGFNQTDYNGRINKGLVGQGWNREQRVVSELGLKCDFEKNGIWVEVEFGNAR